MNSPRSISMWWLMELAHSELFGVDGLELEKRLEHRSAGRLLMEMRQHATALRAECARWDKYMALAPQRQLERKRVKYDQHQAMMKKQHERAKEVKTVINAFEHLCDIDRIKLLTSDHFQFPIDIVPPQMIPKMDSATSANVLTSLEKQRLVEKIDRRKVKWERLKRQFQ